MASFPYAFFSILSVSEELLAESRDNKKLVDAELLQAKTQLEESQKNIKSITTELNFILDQLVKAKEELEYKTNQIKRLQ
ncbi:hypothetical protein AVEN_10599-1, partial [Araneus ventricosus]